MNFSFLENSMLDRTPPSFVIFYFEGATVRLTRRRQYHQPHISVPCLTFHSTLPLGGLFFFHLLRSNGAFIHFWNSFTKGYYVLLKIGGACDFLGCSKNPKNVFFGNFISFLCYNDLNTGRTYVHPQNQTCGAPA